MFLISGGDGYSRRTASVVESVRTRMRAPDGDFARFHTGGGNLSFEAAGSRKNSPPFCANQGSPSISSSVVGSVSHRRSCSAGSSGAARREKKIVRRAIIADDYIFIPIDSDASSVFVLSSW